MTAKPIVGTGPTVHADTGKSGMLSAMVSPFWRKFILRNANHIWQGLIANFQGVPHA